MSAINVIIQNDSASIVTDAAKYNQFGQMMGQGIKCLALPHMPALLSIRGVAAGGFFAETLSDRFSMFDDMVSGIESATAEIVENYSYLWENAAISSIELYIAGWSASRQSFEGYVIRTEELNRGGVAESDNEVDATPFVLVKLPSCSLAPVLNQEQLADVGFAASSVEALNPEVDGRRFLEAQRAMKMALTLGNEPASFVGGFALLSTVTRDGTSQRAIHRWPDELGEFLNRDPVTDWAKWRAAFDSIQPVADTAGLSRLQRERMEKKMRKGTLRAA